MDDEHTASNPASEEGTESEAEWSEDSSSSESMQCIMHVSIGVWQGAAPRGRIHGHPKTRVRGDPPPQSRVVGAQLLFESIFRNITAQRPLAPTCRPPCDAAVGGRPGGEVPASRPGSRRPGESLRGSGVPWMSIPLLQHPSMARAIAMCLWGGLLRELASRMRILRHADAALRGFPPHIYV